MSVSSEVSVLSVNQAIDYELGEGRQPYVVKYKPDFKFEMCPICPPFTPEYFPTPKEEYWIAYVLETDAQKQQRIDESARTKERVTSVLKPGQIEFLRRLHDASGDADGLAALPPRAPLAKAVPSVRGGGGGSGGAPPLRVERKLHLVDSRSDVVVGEDGGAAPVATEVRRDGRGFTCCINLASRFYKSLLSAHGEPLRRHIKSTGARLNVPERGTNGDLVLWAPSAVDVPALVSRVLDVVDEVRVQAPPTHFISVPLRGHDLKKALRAFADSLAWQGDDADAEAMKALLQSYDRLHMVVASVSCVLPGEQRMIESCVRRASAHVMQRLRLGNQLKVELCGIECEPDAEPAAVAALFVGAANPRLKNDRFGANGVEQLMAALVDEVSQTGLVARRRGPLRLRATLMHTAFRDAPASLPDGIAGDALLESGSVSAPDGQTFDARPLLASQAALSLGVVDINELHISPRYRTGHLYSPTAVIQLGN